MAQEIPVVNLNTDLFSTWLDRTNELIQVVNTVVITANSDSNGAITVGNSFLYGIFGSNTVVASDGIRGGNVQSSSDLDILSNVIVNGSIVSDILSIGSNTVYANAIGLFVNGSLSSPSGNLDIWSNITVNGAVSAFDIIGNNITLSGNASVVGLISSNVLSIGSNSFYVDINGIQVTNADIAIASIVSGNIEILTTNNVIVGDGISVGNSTVNAEIRQNSLTIGNNSVNSVVNSTAIVFNSPNGQYIVDQSIGSPVTIDMFTSRFTFSNATTTGTSAQVVDSFEKSQYRACEYTVSIKNNTANGYQTSKVSVFDFESATEAGFTEYATMHSNGTIGAFSAAANTTHILLYFTPVVANTTLRIFRTQLAT